MGKFLFLTLLFAIACVVDCVFVREVFRNQLRAQQIQQAKYRLLHPEEEQKMRLPIHPRFETHRGVFIDDSYIPYQLGYKEPNPWVEKILNKYASKTPDPGNHPLDFGRYKYDPKPLPIPGKQIEREN